MLMAAVLLLLVGITLPFVSGIFAKYARSSTASDTARVALFRVSAEGDKENQIDFSEGKTAAEYTVRVTNDSEVVTAYDLTLSLKKPLPSGVSVTLDGTAPQISDDGLVLTFSPGKMLAVSSSADAQLRFFAENPIDFPSGDSYQESFSFDVTVRFVQVD